MPTWPGTLPQKVQINGYVEEPAPLVLRTQMDAGPAKQRRRATAGASPVRCSMVLDTTQYTTFKTFFDSDIAAGALPFTWVHPVTQAAAELRFAGGSYQISALSTNTFQLSMALEVMP